ncbi:MAG: restriction endonuclease subunit S [Erysipelotrichaceae bacterium]|nr:restriction endonuclease subunit S [Erysipelotrichaceae bacterium]
MNVQFKEVASFINGYPFKPSDWSDTGLPIIRIQDLTGTTDKPNHYEGQYPKKIEVNDGDILISWSASLGVYRWNKGKALLNQHIFKVEFNKKPIDRGYFVWAVEYKLTEMKYKTHGSTMKHIVKGDFDAITIPYPNISDQANIASQLDNIKRLISAKEEELSNLDSLAKSRFNEMFMQGQCDIYPLKKWSEVATIKHGKDYKKSITKKGGYPVFGSGGFMGVFANGFITKKNSTLIGRKGTLDKPIFVKENVWNVDTAFGVEPDEDIVNSTFFFYRSCLYDYKSLSTSTTLPSMTKSTLESLSIGIPPMELQKNFASFVNLIDKSRFIVQSQIKDLQELLDSKMDEYFGGDEE